MEPKDLYNNFLDYKQAEEKMNNAFISDDQE